MSELLSNKEKVGGPDRLKLWVDDERAAPAGWIHARNVRQALLVLRTGQVESLSLDHDLGVGPSGYDVVRWIEERCAVNAMKPPGIITCHSANPVGRDRIRQTVVSIEKLAKTACAEDTHARRLAQLPPGFVDALIAAVQSACDGHAAAIVLYGSFAYGEASAESDIDIAVALKHKLENEWDLLKQIRSAIPDTALAGRDLGLYVETTEQLRRYECVPETMQAAILHQGIVLWGSLAGAAASVLPYTRREVVSQWLARGHRAVQIIAKLFPPDCTREPGVFEGEQLYHAAGWALRAALLAHGIRASDMKLRWVVHNLVELLSLVDTALLELGATVSGLPWWLDAYRYGFVDRPDVTGATCLDALRAAREILHVCTASAERALETVLASDRVELMVEDLQAALQLIPGFACLLALIDYEATHPIRLFVATAAAKSAVHDVLKAFEARWQRQLELHVATEDELLHGENTAAAAWRESVSHADKRITLTGLDRLLEVVRSIQQKT